MAEHRRSGRSASGAVIVSLTALSGYFVDASRGEAARFLGRELARSGTIPAKAMRYNARMACVLWASLPEELAASCGLESAGQSPSWSGTVLAISPKPPERRDRAPTWSNHNARTEQARDRGTSV